MNAMDNQQNSFSNNNLKNYTLTLCQDINVFIADRDLKKPSTINHHSSTYLKTSYDYKRETLGLFVKNFSEKIANCCSEFEKRRVIIDPMLKSRVNNPTTILMITAEIIPSLHSLANQL